MGTVIRIVSLVFGIILIGFGILFSLIFLVGLSSGQYQINIAFAYVNLIIIIVLFAIGGLLLRKFKKDRKKVKSKNSSQIIPDETQFWVCPHCGGDTQSRNGKQFCSKCNVYL